jgi:hypothetical protein
MKAIPILLMGASLLTVFTGCGGDGTYDDTTTQPASPLVERVYYYPNGRVQERGAVKAGTEVREGEWWSYFDDYWATPYGGINQKPKWRRYYSNGTWVESEPWREWNADLSVRDDYTDKMVSP